MQEQNKSTQFYRIEIKGSLDERWRDWFDDLTLSATDDGNTILSGNLADEAARMVSCARSTLGLTLISVSPKEKENSNATRNNK